MFIVSSTKQPHGHTCYVKHYPWLSLYFITNLSLKLLILPINLVFLMLFQGVRKSVRNSGGSNLLNSGLTRSNEGLLFANTYYSSKSIGFMFCLSFSLLIFVLFSVCSWSFFSSVSFACTHIFLCSFVYRLVTPFLFLKRTLSL